MYVIFRSRILSQGLLWSAAVCAIFCAPAWAGYYNLGAFWKASQSCVLLNGGSPFDFGQTAYNTDDSGNGDYLLAQQETLVDSGTLQSLSFYVTVPAGHLRLGVYDSTGASGTPGSLLAQTAEFTPIAGWNTVNVIAPVALSPGTYWLAYFPEDNSLAFKRQANVGSAFYSALTYGPMPGTFPTSANSINSLWALYATLTPDCVAPGSLHPTIASVLPWNGSAGTSITITGTQFEANSTVTVGGVNCPVTAHTGSTSITCTAPSGPSGLVDVIVTDTGGNSATLTKGFGYTACQTISFVQANPAGDLNGGNCGQVSTCTQTMTTSAGNLLVAVAYTDSDIPFPKFTISDTAGNTWRKVEPQLSPDGTNLLQIFYAENTTGGATSVTVSQTDSNYNQAWTNLTLLEYSGVALSNSVEASVGTFASSPSSPDAGSWVAASDCREMSFATYFDGSAGAGVSAGTSGWIVRAQDEQGVVLMEDLLPKGVASGTTIHPTFTAPASQQNTTWVANQITFRAQGSATPPQPTQLAFTTSSQTLSQTWQCSGALTVQAQNNLGQPVRASTPIDVTLGGTHAIYYEDPSCEGPAVTSTQIYAGLSSHTLYFVSTTTGSLTLQASASGLTPTTQNGTTTALAPYTWVGSCSGDWNDSTCWSNNSVPSSAAQAFVHFDSNCASNCTATLSADVTAGGISIHPGSVDTLSLGGHRIDVDRPGGGDVYVMGGTLDLGSGRLGLGGAFYVQGGTVNLASGHLALMQDYVVTGGTVSSSGSTVEFWGQSGCNGQAYNLNPGTALYDNVSFLDEGQCNQDTVTRIFEPGSTMIVRGTLTLDSTNYTGTLRNGAIQAQGNVVLDDLGYAGTTEIQLAGNNQLVDATASSDVAQIPALKIAASGTVTFNGNPSVAGSYTYQSGTLDFTTHDVTLNFWTLTNCDNPVLTLVPGNIQYWKVAFGDYANCGTARVVRRMTPGDSMNILSTLTIGSDGNLPSELQDVVLNAYGDVKIQNLGYRNNGKIRLVGSSAQLIDSTQQVGQFPSMEIAKTGNTATFLGDLQIFGDYSHVSGTVDFATHDSTLIFCDDEVSYTGHSWTLDPGTAVYKNVAFYDGTTGSTGAQRTFASGSTMKIAGNLILDGLRASYYSPPAIWDGILNVSGDVIVEDSGYRGTTDIHLVGSGTQTVDNTQTTVGLIPGLVIASTGSVVFNGDPIIFGNYVYTTGVVDFTTHNVTLRFNDDTYTFTSPYNWTLSPGTIGYNHVSFEDAYGARPPVRTFDNGSTMTINGNLSFDGQGRGYGITQVNQGTLIVKGDITVTGDGIGGDSQITVSGTAAQKMTMSATGNIPDGLFTVAKTGSNLKLLSNSEIEGDFLLSSGTVLLNGFVLTVDGDGTLNTGTTMTQGGGSLNVLGTLTNNGTLN